MYSGKSLLKILVLASILVLCVLLAVNVTGQQLNPSKDGQPKIGRQDKLNDAMNLRVDTTLVLIPVTVTDSMNRFVLGLQKEDFHLSEDGVDQKVEHFSNEDAPLSVGLVFDESGSMDFKLGTSQAAVDQFLKTMNADDEAFLVEFSDSARVSVKFTSNGDTIRTALKRSQPGGLTAMLDAIELALHEMKAARNTRKAIVVISTEETITASIHLLRSSLWFVKPTCKSTQWVFSNPACPTPSRPK